MSDNTVYAEDLNYWKTGKSSPDTWIDRARKEIEVAGGTVDNEAFGRDASGRSAYMLAFSFGADRFRVVWPVLESKSGDERAARIQATTMLYHDVKARYVTAKVLGIRSAFFGYLLLPDGRQAGMVASPELLNAMPKMLKAY